MSHQLISSNVGGSKLSSSSSSSFSSSSASSSTSSTKVVQQSTTMTSSTSKSVSSKSSSVAVKSSGKSFADQLAGDLGIDMSRDMDRLKLCMDQELGSMRKDIFCLMPVTPPPLSLTGGDMPSLSALDTSLVRLDADSVRGCVDRAHADKMKLQFDVTEYESESIHVKAVGNKIEVHAQKKVKKGDQESNEEFSRVYELPTSNAVDPAHVTSSIFQDGVLTIELPVSDALDAI